MKKIILSVGVVLASLSFASVSQAYTYACNYDTECTQCQANGSAGSDTACVMVLGLQDLSNGVCEVKVNTLPKSWTTEVTNCSQDTE